MAARPINNRRPTGLQAIDITVGAASGDQTIIAAPGAGKVIRVYRLLVSCSIANNLTVKSGAGTALTGAIPLAATAPLLLDIAAEWTPWFVLDPNTAFMLNNSAVAALGGHVTYSVETG